jgi:hypothetical protein
MIAFEAEEEAEKRKRRRLSAGNRVAVREALYFARGPWVSQISDDTPSGRLKAADGNMTAAIDGGSI